MTTQKVLLATDGSDQAMRAAETVQTIIGPHGAEVTLLHVLPDPATVTAAISPAGVMVPVPAATDPDISGEDRAEQVLTYTRHVLGFEDERVETMVRHGVAHEEIVAAAEEGDYGLVVVGSRGIGGWKGVLMGSVSKKVAELAPCPVMIVK